MDKIDKLKAHVDKLEEQRKENVKQEEAKNTRNKEINEAPDWTKTDFWCDKCGDVTGQLAYKVIQHDNDRLIAFYEAYKACHKRLRRRITDKIYDPYYLKSKMLRVQRQIHAKDLLQPHEYGFKTLYGDINAEQNKLREEQERANFKKKIIV